MARVAWAVLNFMVMVATCQAAVWHLQRRAVSRKSGLSLSSEELFSLPILLPPTKEVLHAVFDTGSQNLVPCRRYSGLCECINNICNATTVSSSFKAPAVVKKGLFSFSPCGPAASLTYLAYTTPWVGQILEDGIAGFSAGSLSVPGQFKMTRFSFCFSLDPSNSELSWLADGPDARFSEGTIPATVPFENDGYRIRLQSIQIGQKSLLVWNEKMVLFNTGSQGTYLDSDYYDWFIQTVKNQTLQESCDNYEQDNQNHPLVELCFKGGAKMIIPSERYYHGCFPARIQKSNLSDLTVLGIDWLQNHQFLYDLKRRTIAYRAASCSRSCPLSKL